MEPRVFLISSKKPRSVSVSAAKSKQISSAVVLFEPIWEYAATFPSTASKRNDVCWVIFRHTTLPGPEVIKTFFVLNSTEHEILNAHKYKNIKKFGFSWGSDKPRMLFFPFINDEMPTTVGILTFISRKNFMLS